MDEPADAVTTQLCRAHPDGAAATQSIANGANQLYSELSERQELPPSKGKMSCAIPFASMPSWRWMPRANSCSVASKWAGPFPSCVDASGFYSRLVGLRLATGFAAAVRERFGGPAGCTHVNELLSPMATAAFQAIAGARRDRGGPPSPDELGALLNSCHTLREGGQVDRQVRRALRDHDAGRATGSSDD